MTEDSDPCLADSQRESLSSTPAGDVNCEQPRVLCAEVTKANAGLREGLGRAIELGSQVETARARSPETASELGDVKGDRPELEISRQANRELAAKPREERRHRGARAEAAASAASAEIDTVRAHSTRGIDSLSPEIAKPLSPRGKRTARRNALGRVLQSARRYFGRSVSSLDALIQLFDEGPRVPERISEAASQPRTGKRGAQSDAARLRLTGAEGKIARLQDERPARSQAISESETQRLSERTRRRQLADNQTLARVSRSTASGTERFETEKTGSRTAAFAQLCRELENQQADLQHISALLNDRQASAGALRSANEQLLQQNRRLKTDLKASRVLHVKEKKLSELSTVARRAAVESELTQKLGELKTRTEAHKRRLY
jgi:hypothetical protein